MRKYFRFEPVNCISHIILSYTFTHTHTHTRSHPQIAFSYSSVVKTCFVLSVELYMYRVSCVINCYYKALRIYIILSPKHVCVCIQDIIYAGNPTRVEITKTIRKKNKKNKKTKKKNRKSDRVRRSYISSVGRYGVPDSTTVTLRASNTIPYIYNMYIRRRVRTRGTIYVYYYYYYYINAAMATTTMDSPDKAVDLRLIFYDRAQLGPAGRQEDALRYWFL